MPFDPVVNDGEMGGEEGLQMATSMDEILVGCEAGIGILRWATFCKNHVKSRFVITVEMDGAME